MVKTVLKTVGGLVLLIGTSLGVGAADAINCERKGYTEKNAVNHGVGTMGIVFGLATILEAALLIYNGGKTISSANTSQRQISLLTTDDDVDMEDICYDTDGEDE